VYKFAVSSTQIVVNNGSAIQEYSLKGEFERSYSLPAGFADYETGVSAPVLLPSGVIVMSSYYGKAVDGFS
jgi:hypothetical protein